MNHDQFMSAQDAVKQLFTARVSRMEKLIRLGAPSNLLAAEAALIICAAYHLENKPLHMGSATVKCVKNAIRPYGNDKLR